VVGDPQSQQARTPWGVRQSTI